LERQTPQYVTVSVSAVAVVVAMFVLAVGQQQHDAPIETYELTDDVARQTIFDEDLPRPRRIQEMSQFITDGRLPSETRRLAALALARMGDDAAPFAVPRLIEQLQQPEPISRAWSAKALGTFGHNASAAAPELIRLLDHTESGPRNAAIEALAHIGSSHPQVIPVFSQRVIAWNASTSPEYQVSLEYLLDGIGMIGPVASSCIPFVLRTIESPNSRIRLAAVTALGNMGPRADNSIPALAERIVWDSAPDVREHAAIALSKIGEAAIPQLMSLLTVDDTDIRIAAMHAIGAMGVAARQQLPILIARTEDQSAATSLAAAKAVHQVSAGGIDVSPILLRWLSADDRQARMTAVRLFTEIGPHGRTPAVRTALKRLVASSNPNARQAASKVFRDLFER
jgi:HEAT repeat protein